MKLLPLLLLMPALALAQDKKPDEWLNGDKRAHLTSGAIISGVTMHYTRSAGSGFLLGCGAGVAGELADAVRFGRHSYHVSYKDATVQCLGAYMASQTGVWIAPNKIVWQVKW